MKEYNYHPEYKYFLGATDAHISPKEPGKYLISAHATTIEPPQQKEGFVLIFDGESWNLVRDNRGLYYCKDTLAEKFIEDPCCNPDDLNLTAENPPHGERLDHQLIKWCYDNDKWIFVDYPRPEIPPEPEPEILPEPEPESEIIPGPELGSEIPPEPEIENDFEDDLQNMTIEEKLAIIGLSVDDLKALLQ